MLYGTFTYCLIVLRQEYIDLDASQMSAMEPQTPTSSEAPSTPRHSFGTEHDTETDDRDNDNVFVDNSSDVWESRHQELQVRIRQTENATDVLLGNTKELERKPEKHKSSLSEDKSKTKPSLLMYRSPIQSDV